MSDPEKRAAYDVKYDQNRATVLKLFDEACATDSFESDRRVCEGILSLLYVARRRDPDPGGVGIIQRNVCWDALPSTWNFLSGICGKKPGSSAWKMVSLL